MPYHVVRGAIDAVLLVGAAGATEMVLFEIA
jgi:hypothetical protein